MTTIALEQSEALLLSKFGVGKYVLAWFLFTTALGIDKALLPKNRLDLQPSCRVVVQGRIAQLQCDSAPLAGNFRNRREFFRGRRSLDTAC